MTWALIVAGLVHELTAIDPAGRFNASLVWVDVTAVLPAPLVGWVATQAGDGSWSFAEPSAGSLDELASAALAAHLNTGIAITSTGTPALDAVYALDAQTMDQVGAVARDFSSGLGLPHDAGTFTYPDATGTPHVFTGAALCNLYKAQRNLIAALNEQAAVMRFGGSPVWPAQTETIA